MKILIFEADHHGHRLMAVRVLVEALLELKREHELHGAPESDADSALREHQSGKPFDIVLAITKAGAHSEEFAEHLSGLIPEVHLAILPTVNAQQSPWKVALNKTRILRHVLRQERPDHLYIPYVDGMLQIMSMLHRIPGLLRWPATLRSEALMMRGGFAYPGARRLQRWLTLFCLRSSPLNRIHLNDPIPYHYLRKHHPTVKAQLLPDPISSTQTMDKHSARAALGLPLHARIIGCAGLIDKRKGVHHLLEGFWQIPPGDSDNIYLLLAGKQSEPIRQLIAAGDDTSRILCLDRYLTESELNQAICALDLMVSPYADFTGSASMVLRAAAAERMSLTADNAWMDLVVSSFDLGKTCNVKNSSELAAALLESLPEATGFQLSEVARRFVSYGQIDNVNAHWTDLLRARLGLGRHPALRGWPATTSPGSHAVQAKADTQDKSFRHDPHA